MGCQLNWIFSRKKLIGFAPKNRGKMLKAIFELYLCLKVGV
jgi:hypothetical protein